MMLLGALSREAFGGGGDPVPPKECDYGSYTIQFADGEALDSDHKQSYLASRFI